MAKFSGKFQRIRYGTNGVIQSGKVSIVTKVGKHDVASGESGGVGEWVPGVADVDVNIDGFLDLGGDAFTTLAGNVIVPNVKIYLYAPGTNPGTQPFWHFPLFFVEEFEVGAEVRGLVSIKIKGSSQGPYFPPSGI